MDTKFSQSQVVFRRTPPQKDLYRRALISNVPESAVEFIEYWVDLNDFRNLIVLETSSSLNLINFTYAENNDSEYLGCIINLKQLNNFRYINKFLESANEKLRQGGYIIGCVETAKQREQRLMGKFPSPLNKAYLFFDYLGKRVWPKLPYLKKLYFALTVGQNRVISEMETYGRLYSCGFRLVATLNAEGKLYFVAEKSSQPDYNQDASYGPLIRLKRQGKGGKLIKVFKFRTMAPYSEYIQQFVFERYGLQSGGKINNDPRVSPVGRFMRKYWLDELPMLINILRGEMKLVGVRPASEQYLSMYPAEFQEYRKKFKPGFIPPFYADLPKTLEEIVASEARYLEAYERYGLLTDIRYLAKALYNVIVKKARSN